MGDLPLSAIPGSGLRSHEDYSPTDSVELKPQTAENLELLEVLRQSADAGTQSTDSILRAIAEAASVLSGAHGIALALRQDGVIVCRARSGDMAPELGSPLNTDSGISGECLRTATILICNDANTDERVDSGVCRRLGIRSIAVVPLRGQKGIIGILEAFSGRPNAFEKEHIDSLRSLAGITEKACTGELKDAKTPSTKPRAPLFVPAAITEAHSSKLAASSGLSLKRSYWIIGTVAVAVLLISMVIGMSWRQTGADIAASGPGTTSLPAAPKSETENNSLKIPARVSTAPATVRQSDSSRSGGLLRKAAEISPADESGNKSPYFSPNQRETGQPDQPASDSSAAAPPATSSPAEPAPSVDLMPSTSSDNLPRMAASSPQMPTFGGDISQGITEASLIRKVDPAYPPEALKKGLGGLVTLDATIGTDGAVYAITPVSGPTVLEDAAAAAVRQWHYRPAVLNGKPVEVQKRITVMFKLP